ncbi:MAG TPA: hypothetical protein EYP10_11495 [Armatimonadetes bacterium]|nr:hypothetical protein [Armatimonadota bacterium]
MLLQLTIPIHLEDTTAVYGRGGEATYGLWLHLVKHIAPEVAQRWHDARGEKPFTTVIAGGEFRCEHGRMHLDAGNTIYMRVTALSKHAVEVACQVIMLLHEVPIQITCSTNCATVGLHNAPHR